MVSKCANPACPNRFLYLHQGKLFNLTPTPELETAGGGFVPLLSERFWLCDDCCQRMTLVWRGTETKLVPLLREAVENPGKAASDAAPTIGRNHAPHPWACSGVELTLHAEARRTSLMKRK